MDIKVFKSTSDQDIRDAINAVPAKPAKKSKGKAKATPAKGKAKAKATPAKKGKAKSSGPKSRYGHGEGTAAAMMDDLLWTGTSTPDAVKAIGKWQKKEKRNVTAETSRRSAWQTHVKKLRDAGLDIKQKKDGKLKAKSAKM
jgi:hypothetical protein